MQTGRSRLVQVKPVEGQAGPDQTGSRQVGPGQTSRRQVGPSQTSSGAGWSKAKQ